MNKAIVATISFLCFFISNYAFSQQLKEYYIECNQADFQYIYDNYNEEIYVPVTITYNGQTLTKARMRIRGDGSVVLPKKSLKVVIDSLSFPDGKTVFNFNADYEDKSYCQQYLSSRLFQESGQWCFDVEHVRLYMNGEYLGLYVSVENMDENFLINNGFNQQGSLYKATMDGASLSRYDNVYYHWEKKAISESYDHLQQLINMLDTVKTENFDSFLHEYFDYEKIINMLAVNLLIRNYSSYYHNYYMFYDEFGSGKWFMFPWDLDKEFLYYEATIPYYHTSKFWAPDNPVMELALLNEQTFLDIKNRVTELYTGFMNDEHITPWVDSLIVVLNNSVAEDNTDNISSIAEWQTKLNSAKTAFSYRYGQLQNQFNNYPRSFKVSRVKNRYYTDEDILFTWTPTIDPLGETIKYRLFYGQGINLDDGTSTIVNEIADTSYLLTENLAQGKYYYKIEAYTTQLKLEGFDNYNIFFVDNDTTDIMINEINYHSDNEVDPGEWIEIYNNSEADVNLSGWYFSDDYDTHKYVFPAGISLAAHSYFILANDADKFFLYFPSCTCDIGIFNFSLDNDGELLRLFNQHGRLVDSVFYNDSIPWPMNPDGHGPSLELKNPDLDNSIAESWAGNRYYGSPCLSNNSNDTTHIVPNYSVIRCYPNPFTQSTTISFHVEPETTTEIIIADVTGKQLLHFENYYQNEGYYNIDWTPAAITESMYFVFLKENGKIKKTAKVIKVN